MSQVHRKTALRLHGLAVADRRWVMARLAEADRLQVKQYLDELNVFGMDEQTWQALHVELGVTPVDLHTPSRESASLVVDTLATSPDRPITTEQLTMEPVWVAAALGVVHERHEHVLSNVSFTDKASTAFQMAYRHQQEHMQSKSFMVDTHLSCVMPSSASTTAGWFDKFKSLTARLGAHAS